LDDLEVEGPTKLKLPPIPKKELLVPVKKALVNSYFLLRRSNFIRFEWRKR